MLEMRAVLATGLACSLAFNAALPAGAEESPIDLKALMREACTNTAIKDKVLKLIEEHRGKEEREIAVFEIERDCSHYQLSDKPKFDTADLSPDASHSSRVSNVHFASDGKSLLSASHDGTVRIWDLATGKTTLKIDVPAPPPEAKAQPRPAQIGDAIFFDKEKKIAVTQYGAAVQIYDAATGNHITEIPFALTKGRYGLDPHLGATAGPMVLMANESDTLIGYDVEKNAIGYKTPIGALEATGLALSSATQTMAIATYAGVSLRKQGAPPWNIISGNTEARGRSVAPAFSQDGTRFAVGMDNEVVVFDVPGQKEIQRFKIHPLYSVTDLAFTKDGSGIITCQSHPILRDVATGKIVRHYGPFVDACSSISVSLDGKYLAASSGVSPDIRIYEIETGDFERRLGKYDPTH